MMRYRKFLGRLVLVIFTLSTFLPTASAAARVSVAANAPNRFNSAPIKSNLGGLEAGSFAGDLSTDGVTVLSSSAEGLTLEISVPWEELSLELVTVEGRSYTRVSLPGWSETSQAGAPVLPFLIEQLGVPFDANVTVNVKPGTAHTRVLSAPVLARETQILTWTPPNESGMQSLPEPDFVTVEDAGIYDSDAEFPAPLAEVTNDGILRQQRVIGLSIYPLQYRPKIGELTIYESLLVEVLFGGSSVSKTRGVSPDSETYESLFQTELLNYDAAIQFRQTTASPTIPSKTSANASVLPYAPPDPGWRVKVSEPGVYKLTYSDLLANHVLAGSPNPLTFRMFNLGTEIAIFVAGEGDGTFDDGDYILFFGQGIDSKYTWENVYWLTYDPLGVTQGLRMEAVNVEPGTAAIPASYQAYQHEEKNTSYFSQAPGDETLDRFMWKYIYTPYFLNWTQSFNLPESYAGSAVLTISMVGFLEHPNNPDHHIKIYLNDVEVKDVKWNGITWNTVEVSVPEGVLHSGSNAIKLQWIDDLGVGSEVVYIDWFEIEFQNEFQAIDEKLAFSYSTNGTWKFQVDGFTSNDVALFNVTDPASVKYLIGFGVSSESPHSIQFEDTVSGITDYWAVGLGNFRTVNSIEKDTPSVLREPSSGADYIVITHANFATQAQLLADYRAGQIEGKIPNQVLRTNWVDVQDVYDEFGYGIIGAEPIREFLSYAYSHWQGPAPSYVVLLGDGHFDPKNYYKYGRTSYIPPYLAPVDPWITETAADNYYVALTGDDNIPDMMLGRLSVNSASEAAVMVNKIIDYEQIADAGTWQEQLLTAADNADYAGDFPMYSDSLLSCCTSAPFQVEKVYYGKTHSTIESARAAIRASINAGKKFINYNGHGDIVGWASELLLTTSDMSLFTNGNMQPVIISMACRDGFYHNPDPYTYKAESLSEVITRAENKGAIANWSATGLGLASGHDHLSRGFYTGLFRGGLDTLGDATLAGKLTLWSTGANLDLLDTYLLVGDPALHMDIDIVAPPVGTAPEELIASKNPTFEWTVVPDAVQYNLVLMGSVGEILNISVPASSCTEAVCSFQQSPSLELPDGLYAWKVRADMGGGVYTFFSDALGFINAFPPTAYSPKDSISSLNPTFSWSSVGEAERYNLVVKNVSDTEILNASVETTSCSSATCNYLPSPSMNLPIGDYTWKVRAEMGEDAFTDYSNTLAFTNLAVPLAQKPTGVITSRNPMFTWKLATGATKYWLLQKAGDYPVLDMEIVNPNCGSSTCSYTSPTNLKLPNGQYSWTVKAYYDFWGDYGPSKTFTVANPPAPKFPSVSTTSPNPKFIWTKVADQTKYQLVLYNSNNQAIFKQLISSPVCGSTTCSFTPNPGLGLVNGTYKWKIQSYNGMWGAFSALKSFNKVYPPAPVAPRGTIYSKNPVFSWSKIPGATKYYLVIQTSTGVSVRSVEITSPSCGKSTCSYTPNPTLNLAKGSYKWKIKAYNGYYGPPSSYMYFTKK